MTNPNEPTLTCSEVVERLAKCVNEFGPVLAKEWAENVVIRIGLPSDVHDAAISRIQRALLDFAAMRQFDHTKAQGILHSWRERRVQELEELLAKHPLSPEPQSTQRRTVKEKQ